MVDLRFREICVVAAVFSVALLPGSPATAQGGFVLVPEHFQAERGETISLQVREGQPAEPGEDDVSVQFASVPWPVEDVLWFFQRASGYQSNADSVEPFDAEKRTVVIEPAGSGVLMFGVDLKDRVEEFDAQALRAFAEHHIDARVVEQLSLPEDGLVPVRVQQSAKTFVKRGGTGGSSITLSKSGQRGEIRPVMDPTGVEPGSVVLFRLYMDVSDTTGLRVTATHVDSGAQLTTTVNGDGLFHFTFARTGTWFVEVHSLRASEAEAGDTDQVRAAFELTSVTLSFANGTATQEHAP